MTNSKQAPPPKEWQPTQALDDPVINKPYEEPLAYWQYRDGIPTKMQGRRPARYYFKNKRVGSAQQTLFQDEQEEDLPLINALREDVKRWRTSGYKGATGVTKELLRYWMRDDRARRLFFCQRESVETFIYLLELAIPGRLNTSGYRNFKVDADNISKLLKGEKPDFESLVDSSFFPRLVDFPIDDDMIPLRRLGCKMATGSGKTIVMAMLIAWAFCNRGQNQQSTQFPSAVLICAPNLTVRKRLSVLKPEDPDNYYDAFEIAPPKYRAYMNKGKVLVTNWHKFHSTRENVEDGKSYRVVDKGKETTDAFTLDRLGELADHMPILVLNDEGHHCWRPKPAATEIEKTEIDKSIKAIEKELNKDEKAVRKDAAEEARVWLAGLDKINNCGLLGYEESGSPKPGILACIDLSATPFYLGNSGYPEGSPFPWLVSDFGLVDAIECGITKVPRLPVGDDSGDTDEAGRPDPKYFRLWEKIKDECQASEKIRNTPKPEAIYKYSQDALVTLASQWKIQFDEADRRSGGKPFIPPVMIVVCDNTDVAQLFYEKIAGETEEDIPNPEKPGKTITIKRYGSGDVFPSLLSNTEDCQRTIRIDSKLLDKVEKEDGESKDQAALRLREIIDTVGKRGGLGEQIRCVVSVSMLTEGWDANNVSHILGVRAFGSQLLCEQVVGRGLRRMSYEIDPETGRLPAEYADVYGIPFSLVPYKGKSKDDPDRPDPVYRTIHAVEERADYEIRLPNVEGYVYELKDQGITCDIDSLEPIVIDQAPGQVWLRPTRGYHDEETAPVDVGDYVTQTREEYYQSIRPQQLVFRFAQMVLDDLMSGDREETDPKKAELRLRSRQHLFPEIVGIIQQYIKKKVVLQPGLDARELGLERYAQQLVERIRDNILPAVAKESKLIPVINRFNPYNSTKQVNYHTSRTVVDLTKSHLNRAMTQNGWEEQAIEVFEDLAGVLYYTPNDRQVGLTVPYDYDGQTKIYEPDFVVCLVGGKTIMLEIKGGKGKVHDPNRVYAKNAAAKKWCAAVSNLGRYGQWVYEICEGKGSQFDANQLRTILNSHIGAFEGYPFEVMDKAAGQLWRDCVPLTTLRTVVRRHQDHQSTLDAGTWDTEWVSWNDHPGFSKGMFVARVSGANLEPDVPANSYCLFRPKDDQEEVAGQIALMRHAGVMDPLTGGDWTVRRVSFEEHTADDEEWGHTRMKLSAVAEESPPYIVSIDDSDEVECLGILHSVLEPPSEAGAGE